MDKIFWNPEKNDQLKKLRKVTFGDLLDSRFIGTEDHPTKKHQKLMLFEYKKYVWVMPYVEGKDYLFLTTAFQSRKYTKKYLRR